MNKISKTLARIYALSNKRLDKSKKKTDKNAPQFPQKQKIKAGSVFLNKMTAHDKELFVKRLSYLLKAGVPILQSLEMIREQTTSGFQKKIIGNLMVDISNGQTLHGGLNKFRNLFGDFIINVIRVGEGTGLLHQNLDYLADELKKSRVLKKKIISALIYPIFIAAATICITIFLVLFIFPKILPILKSLNVQLPIFTRILIGFSDFLAHNGLFVILGIAVFGFLVFLLSKVKRVIIIVNNLIPSIPVLGQLLQNYNITNISRTLGMLLKSNVTLIEAIKITSETTPNIVYKKILEDISNNILKGKKISGQFKNYPRFFPVLIPQMLSIGETTGNLGGSLIYLAEFYETEVEEASKNLSNVLEPLLMILMGLIVGSVVISIITPIYGITQHLNVR
jgi:type IV pilus assembly protein PilC